jgi:hypothetical protein
MIKYIKIKTYMGLEGSLTRNPLEKCCIPKTYMGLEGIEPPFVPLEGTVIPLH